MKMYQLQLKANNGRIETIVEAKYIGELRHKWDNYLKRWLCYWSHDVYHLMPNTTGQIAHSMVSRIVMNRIEVKDGSTDS